MYLKSPIAGYFIWFPVSQPFLQLSHLVLTKYTSRVQISSVLYYHGLLTSFTIHYNWHMNIFVIDDCLLAALNFSTFNSRESTSRVDFKMLNVNRFDFIKVWCWDELYHSVQDTKFLGSVSCISSITLEIRLNQLLLIARYLDLILSTSRKPGDLETWVLHSFQRIYIYLFYEIYFS